MGVPGAILGLIAFGPGTGLAGAADDPLLPAPALAPAPPVPPAALHIVAQPTTNIAIKLFVFIVVSCSSPRRFIEEEPVYFDPAELHFGLVPAHCFDPAEGNFGPAPAYYFGPAELYFGLVAVRCFDRPESYFGPAPVHCFDPEAENFGPAADYFALTAFDFEPAGSCFGPESCHFE
jgi:hypothetical protein